MGILMKFRGQKLEPELVSINWMLLRETGIPLSERKDIICELFGLPEKMVNSLFEKTFPEKYMGKKRIKEKKDEYFCYKHQGKLIYVPAIDLIKEYCHREHPLYRMAKIAGEL